ncbi:hypothetical protein M768_02015 [Cellulosimicrobium cellulans F16]|uniref:Uncharacterized protein n=1 Tax=Cellulosimicrobium cellulans F16 TaxID=1350482 RepID=A0A0M0FBA0_CELCE|nr:hypothetical protein M768_02015 [Cellulosimicrobium cellulans F16]
MAGVTAPEQPSSVPSPRRPRVATVVLAALLLVGVGLLVAASWVASRPASFGWFAYAPVSGTAFVPSGVFGIGRAAFLAGAGALLVGGAVGFLVGRATAPTVPGGSGAAGRGPGDPRTSGPTGDEASAG